MYNHSKLCTPSQSSWLRRFYDNSEAFHERQVLERSMKWKKDMEVLKVCWGNPAPKTLEIQSSPEDCPIHIVQKKKIEWITNGPHNSVGFHPVQNPPFYY